VKLLYKVVNGVPTVTLAACAEPAVIAKDTALAINVFLPLMASSWLKNQKDGQTG
jgi:hypothetical protein